MGYQNKKRKEMIGAYYPHISLNTLFYWSKFIKILLDCAAHTFYLINFYHDIVIFNNKKK